MKNTGKSRLNWRGVWAVALTLALTPLSSGLQPAEAKPPRHAPAHGYRAKKKYSTTVYRRRITTRRTYRSTPRIYRRTTTRRTYRTPKRVYYRTTYRAPRRTTTRIYRRTTTRRTYRKPITRVYYRRSPARTYRTPRRTGTSIRYRY